MSENWTSELAFEFCILIYTHILNMHKTITYQAKKIQFSDISSNKEIDLVFPSFSTQHFPNPSVVLWKDVFLKRIFQNEDIYIDAMRSLKANWITCDHTLCKM